MERRAVAWRTLCGQGGSSPRGAGLVRAPRTRRRDDDRDGVDDWLGDFYHIGGIIAARWRARLVAPRMGYRRSVNDYRRVVLLGLATMMPRAGGVYFLREAYGNPSVPVRLDPVSGD
jgi:hypothetical protein